MKKEFKRILIVRTDRIGDVVLSTPAIKAVRGNFPSAFIAIMVAEDNRQLVQGNPHLDEVITLDKNKRHKGLLGSLCLIRELKSKDFDLALILHGTKRVQMLIFLAGIPQRIGYRRKWWKLLTRAFKNTKPQGEKTETEYSLDLLRNIGLEAPSSKPYFPLDLEAEKKVEEIFEEEIHLNHPVVAINPGASCPSKRWPVQRFSELSKKIIEEFKANIIIISGKDDNLVIGNKLSELINSHHVLNLSGKLSLLELGSVLKRCNLFISNDSGPVHIASALATPVISIFSRNLAGLSPKRWQPLGENSFYIHKKVGCTDCLAHNCRKEFACLKAISVDEVYSLAEDILKGRF